MRRMAWEKRKRGGAYYYRSRRVAGRVVKEYVGRGPLADLAAAWAEEDRAARLAALEADRRRRAELDDVAQQVGEVCQAVDDVAAAWLTLAGYHRHDRGAWRKRRAPKERRDTGDGDD